MPPSAEIPAALARLPHFRALDDERLSRIAGCCTLRTAQAREELFREGQPCDAFWAVVEGMVRVYRTTPDGREQVVHHVPAGRTFAEAALFHYRVYPASAAVETGPARVLRVDGRRFGALLAEEPALAAAMIGSLCGWMHTLLDRIELLGAVGAGARLAQFLLGLPAKDEGGSLVVALPVAKKTLAAELAITPETLSRLLGRWKELGLVAVKGQRITLVDVRALQAVAGGSR